MAFAPQINWSKHERKNNNSLYIILFSLILGLVFYYFLSNFYFAFSVFLTAPIFLKSGIMLFKIFPKNNYPEKFNSTYKESIKSLIDSIIEQEGARLPGSKRQTAFQQNQNQDIEITDQLLERINQI